MPLKQSYNFVAQASKAILIILVLPPLSCRLHSYCWILSEDRLEYGKVYSEMWIERIYNLFRSLSTQQCQVSSNTQTWWKIVPWIDAYKIKVSRIYIPPNYYIFITFIFEHWHKLGFIIRSWKLSLGILFSDFKICQKVVSTEL